jgi:hypothetical protein
MSLLKKFKAWWRRISPPGGSEFLCDTCKYDHPSACNHRERPNARTCDDYRRKGT